MLSEVLHINLYLKKDSSLVFFVLPNVGILVKKIITFILHLAPFMVNNLYFLYKYIPRTIIKDIVNKAIKNILLLSSAFITPSVPYTKDNNSWNHKQKFL